MTTKRKPGAPQGNQNARKHREELGKPIALRLPADLRTALDRTAEREGITPAQYAARVVSRALE